MDHRGEPESEKISGIYSKCLKCGKLFRSDRGRFHECSKSITKDALKKLEAAKR